MKFKVRFTALSINEQMWRQKLAAMLAKEIKKAATVWLNATVLLVIPVWSGASRATFLKLARAISFPLTINIQAPSGFIERAPNRWGPRIGFQRSEGTLDASNAANGLVSFFYSTDLFHLVFNEYNDGNANPVAGRVFARLHNPGPYGFQQIGQAAFEDYARLVELPSPWRSLKFTKIRVG